MIFVFSSQKQELENVITLVVLSKSVEKALVVKNLGEVGVDLGLGEVPDRETNDK